MDRHVLYDGSPRPPAPRRELRAGPLSFLLDAEQGAVYYIKYGEHELLRSIYSAVRDRNWGTVPPLLSDLKIVSEPGHVTVTFVVECRQGEIDFVWQGTIAATARGALSFTMDGTARSTFQRNRLGFCVLHPMEAAGAAARIEQVDGRTAGGAFPTAISPDQPFMALRAITHEVAPGLWARVGFEGDEFEMEDQRNWTDASFKTYCTPLRLPFPVEVPAGARIVQTITVAVEGPAAGTGAVAGAAYASPVPTVTVGTAAPRPLPRLGLGMASHGRPLSAREQAWLRALRLSHLRVDLRLGQPGWRERLRQAAAEAGALGCTLEAAVTVTDAAEQELAGLAAACHELAPPVGAFLFFHAAEKSVTTRWVRVARQALRAYDGRIPIGGGTNCFFTELNRGRPPQGLLDVVAWSSNPQVHAFDNLSLVETLAAQVTIVATARAFVGDTPIAVSPVTLRMRFNPNATGPEPEPAPGDLPYQVDPRQLSLFGAGWTLGSIKCFAEAGVQSLTYYETTGWRGVMETEAGPPLPDRFPSLPGATFPLYHVLADLGEFAGGHVVPAAASDILSVAAMAVEKDGRRRLLLANLTAQPQVVRVLRPGLGEYVRIKRLDETTAGAAMRTPAEWRAVPGLLAQTAGDQFEVALLPYAVLRIDSEV